MNGFVSTRLFSRLRSKAMPPVVFSYHVAPFTYDARFESLPVNTKLFGFFQNENPEKLVIPPREWL